MSQGADTADQVVQEGIQVTESAVKLAGLGVKNLAILLLQLLQDNKKLKGKTGLNNLLRSDQPLVTFTVDKTSLPGFKKMAGEYGVLFSSVHQQGKNGQCDIMVRAQDASLVHRIFENIKMPAQPAKQGDEGKSTQNWFRQVAERFTDPAKRFEGKTGPLESLGAETLAALVYQLAAENREHLEAAPLSRIFEDGKSLQFSQVPDYCKKDVLEQAEILDIPVHFQAADTPGKIIMMAKAEDAHLVNRLFENMGLAPPMKTGEKQQAPSRDTPVVSRGREAVSGQKKDGDSRSSVKVSFAKAKAKSEKAAKARTHAAPVKGASAAR